MSVGTKQKLSDKIRIALSDRALTVDQIISEIEAADETGMTAVDSDCVRAALREMGRANQATSTVGRPAFWRLVV